MPVLLLCVGAAGHNYQNTNTMNNAQSQSPPPNNSGSQPTRGRFLWFWRWFWWVTLVVSLGYAWYSFYVPSNNISWADDYASAQRQAVQSGKPVILFFTATWCVPCRIMKRNVWADEQVAEAVNARFIAAMIDVNDPDAAAALGRYPVRATPTTIFTDPHGKVLQQIEGGIDKPNFLQLLGLPQE